MTREEGKEGNYRDVSIHSVPSHGVHSTPHVVTLGSRFPHSHFTDETHFTAAQ